MGRSHVLTSILDGSYNLGREIGVWHRRFAVMEKEYNHDAALTPVQEAVHSHNYAAAAKGIDKLITVDPNAAPDLLIAKVEWLSKQDPSAAMRFALQLADTKFKGDTLNLTALAQTLVEDRSPISHVDYAVALNIAQKAVDSAPDDPEALNALALAYLRVGHRDKAVSTEAKAVDAASKKTDFDPDILADYKAKLNAYRSPKRTVSSPAYEESLKHRYKVEGVFGWGKSVAGMRQTKLRGQSKVAMDFTLQLVAKNLLTTARRAPNIA